MFFLRRIVHSALILTVMRCSAAQEPRTDALEATLLVWPGFAYNFSRVFSAWSGVPGWAALDARWKGRQEAQPRYAVLRGLLAERQGLFSAAVERYAEAGEDQWGLYHRGRVLALMGKVYEARTVLEKAAARAHDPVIFKQAATGVGSLLLLRDGAGAAEKWYDSLWQTHSELRFRLALVEPLLGVRFEMGKGQKWLDGLRPKASAGGSPAADQLESAIIWFLGNSLTKQPVEVPPWLLEALGRPGNEAWRDALVNETGRVISMDAAVGTGPRLINLETPVGGGAKGTEASPLELTANEKQWLQTSPLDSALFCVTSRPDQAARARLVHDHLDQKIFLHVRGPRERLMLLLLRSLAGEPPEVLRNDAIKLWGEVDANDYYPASERRETRPALATVQYTHGTVPMMGERRIPGFVEPTNSVIWNLRGDSFTVAAQAAVQSGVERVLIDDARGIQWSMLDLPPTPQFSSSETLHSPAEAREGAALMACMWSHRKRLGLEEALRSSQGAARCSGPADVSDLLVRHSVEEIVATILQSKDIPSLPTRWVLRLRHGMEDRLLRLAVERKSPPPDVTAARRKLDEIILAKHPSWLGHAWVNLLPLPELSKVSHAQIDELLAGTLTIRPEASSPSGVDAEGRRKLAEQWWRAVDPSIADERALRVAAMEARQRLELNKLPYALYGLNWQPSLRADALIVMPPVGMRSAASSKSFLTDILPQMAVKGETKVDWSVLPPEAALSLAWKLLADCYGNALTEPQPNRVAEMRPFAARFPVVAGLIELWRVQESDSGDVQRSATSRNRLAAKRLMAMLEVLQRSKSDRARFALAVLHRQLGDLETARRYAASVKNVEGPLSLLASTLEPEVIKHSEDSLQALRDEQIQLSLKRAMEAFMQSGKEGRMSAEDIVHGYPNTPESKRAIYDWLKTRVKPEPAFALEATALAILARELNLPAQESTEAEQLDLQLNATNPEVWLRRGVAYVKQGNEKYGVDMFIEAVRRFDLANLPNIEFTLAPGGEGWMSRALRSGRRDELGSAFLEALAHAPANAMGERSASMMLQIFFDGDARERPARIERILDAIQPRQKQVLLGRFSQFREQVFRLDRAGQSHLATRLARDLLLSWWPESFPSHNVRGWGSGTNGVSQGVWDALASWGSHDEVRAGAPILSLMEVALRGESADFIAECELTARLHPKQEQAVSCAVVVHALRGPLPAKKLHLADKLDDQAKMRVAWCLCELAPPGNVDLPALAPMLEKGVRSMMHDTEKYIGNGSQHFAIAFKVMPWLTKAGGPDSQRLLLPDLRHGLAGTGEWMFPHMWQTLSLMAISGDDEESVLDIGYRWRQQCSARMGGRAFTKDWMESTTVALSSVAIEGGVTRGKVFASLAWEVWRTYWQRNGTGWDPSIKSTALLADALTTIADEEAMSSLADALAEVVRLGGESGNEVIAERLLLARRLFRVDGAELPAISLWTDPATPQGDATRIHWALTLGQDDENVSRTATIAWSGGRFGRETGGVPESRAVLQALAGRFDLEILAGGTEDTVVPVTKVRAAMAEGSVEVEGLPASGWIRGMLRRPRDSAIRLGRSITYSLAKPLFDSSLPDAGTPGWRDLWVQRYGKPVSPEMAVVKGAELLLTIRPDTSGARYEWSQRFSIVAMDDRKEPCGAWILSPSVDRVSETPLRWECREDGSVATRIRPAEWLARDGWLRLQGKGGEKDGNMAPNFIIVTSSAGPQPGAVSVTLQPFSNRVVDEKKVGLSLLEDEFSATLGFKIESRHLASRWHRAAFTGEHTLVVFDTSTQPWRRMMKRWSAQITPQDRIFLLQNGTAHLIHLSNNAKTGYRVIPLENEKPLDEERVEIPFSAGWIELSPNENGVILCAPSIQSNPCLLRAAWLDAGGQLLSANFERPITFQPGTTVAWWDKNGSVTLHEDGVLFHLQRTSDKLVLVKQESGSPKRASLPQKAVTGQFWQPQTWLLRRPDVLVERDAASGSITGAYRLRVNAVGTPMTMGESGAEIFLETDHHDIVVVKPGDRGH